MPKFLEKKLKAKYGADSAVPYKIMNKIGAMRGSKITAKGEAMERKHEMGLQSKKGKKKKKTFAEALQS